MFLSDFDRNFILNNENKDVSKLALELRKADLDIEHVEFVLKQISGRQVAKIKIPSWYQNQDVIFPKSLSMEQSSSEQTAKYKAQLIDKSYKTLVDLTGGLGVDFYFMSRCAHNAVYVEQNEELCEIANHNFKSLELENFEVINADGVHYLSNDLGAADIIYIDPARRISTGQKVFFIEDCTPNIIDIQDILVAKSKKTIVKFSPMLDISSALRDMPYINEIHIVSVDNECKELLFVLSKDIDANKRIVAVNIKKNEKEVFNFTTELENNASVRYTDTVGRYLYEPNASILKSGAFKYVGEFYDLDKLHPNSHLYTSESFISNFPGRVFEVSHWLNPNKKNVAEFVKTNKKVNITVRNYPISVSEIRKSTKLQDGGDIYLFATTLCSGKKVWIVCSKVL